VSKRRARGEGSIFKRQDEIWVGKLSLGIDGRGKRRRKVVYGSTKAVVVEQLIRLRAKVLDGALGDPTRTSTAEFLGRWLADVARPGTAVKTYELYEMVVRRHVIPHIGHLPLSKLAPLHLQGMLGALERQQASPRLRQLALSIVSRAIKQAVRWRMLPQNPADAVTAPRVPKPEIHPLDSEQVAMLLEAAREDRLSALYVLALSTGMRQGELFGLWWADVDLVGAVVQIHRQLHESNAGELWIGDLKTAKAKRRVDLPALAIEALRDHRRQMLLEGHAPHRDALVFSDVTGQPIRKSNFIRRSFHPLLRRAGLPHMRFHDLRHTHATLLLQQGVHPKVVQERLGHSTISMTLDTYSHVVPGLGREAAAKIDAVLRGGAPAAEEATHPAATVP
jgi:integrase